MEQPVTKSGSTGSTSASFTLSTMSTIAKPATTNEYSPILQNSAENQKCTPTISLGLSKSMSVPGFNFNISAASVSTLNQASPPFSVGNTANLSKSGNCDFLTPFMSDHKHFQLFFSRNICLPIRIT